MGSLSVQRSSEYQDDDDTASNSSTEVEKPSVPLLGEEADSSAAIHGLQKVLSGLKMDDEPADPESPGPASVFRVPSLLSSRDTDKDDLFANLPDDCLAAVFRKLGNKDLAQCSLVCKWWFMVDALSRTSLSLRAMYEVSPHLPKLLARFNNVHKLVLKGERNSPSVDDASLEIIAECCPRLRKFKLKNCKQVTDVGMERFAQACPDLRKFSSGGCGFGVAGLSALLRHCTGLEDLTIKKSIRNAVMGGPVDPPAMETVTVNLEGGGRVTLALQTVYNLLPQGNGPAADADGQEPIRQGDGVGAGGGRPPMAPQRDTGTGKSVMPQLDLPETLSLKRLCLKDQSVSLMWAPLLEAAKKVETLILARNLGSWDPVLASSLGAGNMPELTQLYLERLHITDRGLRSVACCPKLEALVVVRTAECTDDGISAISQGCSTLKRLHIEGWAPGHIGDRGLNALAHHCKLLQELVLVGHSCTIASMKPLANNCPKLERLTLCQSLSMTDKEMKVIAQSCPNLRRLCVKACMRVTDLGIISLATGCPALQKLKIRRCTSVTQTSLDFLQEQRPDLAITQESTASSHRHRRADAAADGGGGAGAGGAGGAEAGRRQDPRDESLEALGRIGSLQAAADHLLATAHRGPSRVVCGPRNRFAHSIRSMFRHWMGTVGVPANDGQGTSTQPQPQQQQHRGLPPPPPPPLLQQQQQQQQQQQEPQQQQQQQNHHINYAQLYDQVRQLRAVPQQIQEQAHVHPLPHRQGQGSHQPTPGRRQQEHH